MHRRLVGFILASSFTLGVVPVTAQTPEPPAGLVWMALRDINENTFDRDDPTNRPPLVTVVPEGMIKAVDVTPDGRADWLVDYGPSGISAYCGTGGCRQILYVSNGDDGLTRAFDQQALDLRFYASDGERRIEAWVHHGICSSDATQECLRAFAWDAAAGRLVERPTRDGQMVIAVGIYAPIDRSEENEPDERAPGPVADLWFTTRTTCAAYDDDGLEVRRAALSEIADVDGDAVRDWVVEPPSPCQVDADDVVPYPGFQVWLTRPQGEAVEAYTSPAERYPYIDVSGSQAVVVTRPSCGLDETCASKRLRWDARSGRLVE